MYFYHSEWNNSIADIQVGREKNQYVKKKHGGHKKDPNLASKDEKINIRVKKNIYDGINSKLDTADDLEK